METRLDQFLSSHKVLNLAYTSNSIPQSCALWYVHDSGFHLYFLSSTSTLHGSTLQDGAPVAFTINQDDQEWDKITGVQGRGYVQLVDESAHDDAWGRYITKYPFTLLQFPALDQALKKTKLWVIKPSWYRLIDNSITFGHKEEIHFDT